MMMLTLLTSMALLSAPATGISAMQWEKRVLLVSAADARDPALAEQRRIVARWRSGADARDLAMVEIVGDAVQGANDSAPALRRRFALPATGFAVVLIGKDGGAKLRGTRPLSAATLAETIDAMPMRRHARPSPAGR
jgi:hypothetical protein